MAAGALENLILMLGRLPGIGPRSARRVALAMLQRRDSLMRPLGQAILNAADAIRDCQICGNLDTTDPCAICADTERTRSQICVVAGVADLWAIERTGAFKGRYAVLGGTLSAIDGIGPEDLGIPKLIARAHDAEVTEVILGLNATVDAQTTGHYIAEQLHDANVEVTRLAHGIPVGGEMDYLDDGTLTTALRARRRQ
ncbi:MAG: recombination protein RecR [Alphaproteobacteria bacterium]|nr:recombination protein RecR [Alphaproteobacteria bacterium]MAS48527.1 recombination protein RecR [Alphaproteobacteria bacterium]MBN54771.1 recombination protein RecR [Alphaproteobacteria bacterium]OUT39182.1 MAG: recombination protein RecR [Micavibrio sp. TMED2]|tara:strand:+ start:15357 stop:15950 length:594 start_codon:yes stop_codon:yes gene_type:complete